MPLDLRFGPLITRSMASSMARLSISWAPGTGAQQRGLVEHVGQIGAGEARRAHGDGVQIHIRHERLALGVHLEDGLTAFQVRGFHGHLTVETTGAQQRGVEHVRAVGGRDDDQVRVVVEAVHLHEQLVQGLLAFVMAAAHAGAHGGVRRRRSRR